MTDFPSSGQHILQDQIALLYKRIFTSPIPPPPFFSSDWECIILFLLKALHSSSSPLSRRILNDVLNHHIPTWLRTYKSTSLLYNIGDKVCFWADDSPKHAIELFIHLDKIMVEFTSQPEEVEGLDEETVKRWKGLRASFTSNAEETHGLFKKVSEQFQLPVGHFENLPGHGPLLWTASLQPLPPSPSSNPDLKLPEAY